MAIGPYWIARSLNLSCASEDPPSKFERRALLQPKFRQLRWAFAEELQSLTINFLLMETVRKQKLKTDIHNKTEMCVFAYINQMS